MCLLDFLKEDKGPVTVTYQTTVKINELRALSDHVRFKEPSHVELKSSMKLEYSLNAGSNF